MTTQSRGLKTVLYSQFFSALADNALLFGAIALLKAHNAPAWHTPLLQEAFLLAYIMLAPIVGHVADAAPKGRVMFAATGLKLLGAFAMFVGVNALFSYALVGVGAAAYSPAKYGILGELVPSDLLVKANGMLESSNSVAMLLGVVAGGYLADQGARLAIGVTVGLYVVATVMSMCIPVLAPSKGNPLARGSVIANFVGAVRTLMGNPDGRFGLLGTSIFVGTGSTLRFLLVAWVPVALGITDTSTPAILSGAVAIGIALGAAAAARFVSLERLERAVPAGLAFGVLIMALAVVTNLPVAAGLLVTIGVCGGFFVVPLKALLQERGQDSVGSGSAISVQNIFGNVAMLLMVGAYTGMTHSGLAPVTMATVVGVAILAGIGALTWRRQAARPAA